MKVYIEYVLIDNFLIDYMLLKATFAMTGNPVSRKRLFLVSLLGSLFSLFLPLIERVGLVAVLYKIATGFFLVLVSIKHYNFRSFFVASLMFFFLTFLTGGGITGIFGLLNLDYNSEFSIALMFAPVYLLIKITGVLFGYFSRKSDVKNFVYQVEMQNGKFSAKLKGLLDSGNTVYYKGDGVVFIGKRLAKKLLYANPVMSSPFKMQISTVLGQEYKTAFKTDRLKIYIDGKANIFKGVTVCVVDQDALGDYQIILHPAFFKETSNDKIKGKIEKVS